MLAYIANPFIGNIAPARKPAITRPQQSPRRVPLGCEAPRKEKICAFGGKDEASAFRFSSAGILPTAAAFTSADF
jgi:hypothetical protein